MANEFDLNFKPTESPINQQSDIFGNLNKAYTGAIGSQEKTPSLISRYDQMYGVPQMQAGIQAGTEQYDALGNTIRNLPKDIAQRSQESILTQGQKNRQVQSESVPLLEQQGILGQNLARQQANLGVAQSNASRMVSAEQVDQEKALMPFLKQYDTENILSSMRMTGWNFENQTELTRLITNIQNGITLSEGEKNRMQQLAIAEKGFENTLKQQKMINEKSTATKTQDLMSVGAGTSVFDPSTGKFIGTAPYKPEAGTGTGNYTPVFENYDKGYSTNDISSLWNTK